MLQQSGPVNTPRSGWRLKIVWPAFRRLEIPQTGPLPLRQSAPLILVAEPRARNRIFAARDKVAKSAVLPPQRPVGAYHMSHDARKCGLFSRSSESAWWACLDSNQEPDRYERPALTIELQAPPRAAEMRPATVRGPFTR